MSKIPVCAYKTTTGWVVRWRTRSTSSGGNEPKGIHHAKRFKTKKQADAFRRNLKRRLNTERFQYIDNSSDDYPKSREERTQECEELLASILSDTPFPSRDGEIVLRIRPATLNEGNHAHIYYSDNPDEPPEFIVLADEKLSKQRQFELALAEFNHSVPRTLGLVSRKLPQPGPTLLDSHRESRD